MDDFVHGGTILGKVYFPLIVFYMRRRMSVCE